MNTSGTSQQQLVMFCSLTIIDIFSNSVDDFPKTQGNMLFGKQ